MGAVNTHKTLTQARGSNEGTPTINGAIYLSQDQSSQEELLNIKTIDKDDEVIIDLKCNDYT